MSTPSIIDRFNGLFKHARAAKNEEVEAEARLEEQREHALTAALYRWAMDDVASSYVLPTLDRNIDLLEKEQADNVENHAKMIMLQGRVLAWKDIRRMFQDWRRLDAGE